MTRIPASALLLGLAGLIPFVWAALLVIGVADPGLTAPFAGWVALSGDGRTFTKPALELYEVAGTRANNVVLANAAPVNACAARATKGPQAPPPVAPVIAPSPTPNTAPTSTAPPGCCTRCSAPCRRGR